MHSIKCLFFVFREIVVSCEAQKFAQQYGFELQSCGFTCKREQLRNPKIIRVGLFQNQIPLPTWTPIAQMRDAMFKMAKEALEVAALSNVNIFCFQEAWSKLLHTELHYT